MDFLTVPSFVSSGSTSLYVGLSYLQVPSSVSNFSNTLYVGLSYLQVPSFVSSGSDKLFIGLNYTRTSSFVSNISKLYIGLTLTSPDGAAAIKVYADRDRDGYFNNTDCNDTNSSIYQLLNGFRDADKDSYGAGLQLQVCSGATLPIGYSTVKTDCNDNNASIYPGAIEKCNGIDDNCNNITDEGFYLLNYSKDFDNDGYGISTNITKKCFLTKAAATAIPSGNAARGGDCNDTNANINPAMEEKCNGIDDNCNNKTDENCDKDQDGYINPLMTCVQPVNFSFNICRNANGLLSSSPPLCHNCTPTDCNDGNTSIHPGATELCNHIDDNCDGKVDEGCPITRLLFYEGKFYSCNVNSTHAITLGNTFLTSAVSGQSQKGSAQKYFGSDITLTGANQKVGYSASALTDITITNKPIPTNTHQQCAVLGDWFCGFGNTWDCKWKYADTFGSNPSFDPYDSNAKNQLNIECLKGYGGNSEFSVYESKGLPPDEETYEVDIDNNGVTEASITFNNATPLACCPEDWCYDGAACIPNQANSFGTTVFEYLPQGAPLSYRTGGPVPPSNFKFSGKWKCVNGHWREAVISYDWYHQYTGVCNDKPECFISSQTAIYPELPFDTSVLKNNLPASCLPSKGFYQDHFCYQSNWTSRTRFIAMELFNFAKDKNSYVLYCDDPEESINEPFKLFNDMSVDTGVVSGEKKFFRCGSEQGACANKFCSLRWIDASGEHVIVGTSLNVPINKTVVNALGKQVSFMNIMNKSKSFCNNAVASADDNFIACSPDSGKSAIWYNPKTQMVVFSDEVINWAPSGVLNWLDRNVLNTVLTPFKALIGLITGSTAQTQSMTLFLTNASRDFERVYMAKDTVGLTTRSLTAMKEKKVSNGVITTSIIMKFEGFTDNITRAVDDFYYINPPQGSEPLPDILKTTEGGKTVYSVYSIHDSIPFWKSMTAKLRVESFKKK